MKYFKSIILFNVLAFCSYTSVWSQLNKTAADNYFEISKNLELTTNIYKELNELYVDPIEPGKLFKTSLDAMLKQLDPYTVYISESEIEDMQLLQSNTSGSIGFGIFKHPNGKYIIEHVQQNSDADKVGLKDGYELVKVAGKDVSSLSLEQVGLLLRGANNASISIEVRNWNGSIASYNVKRSQSESSTVNAAKLIGKNKDIAYVSLAQFTAGCAKQIRVKLDSLKTANNGSVSGVVLDLGGNPGGLLDEAVKLCNLFVDKGQVIVTTKGQGAEWDKTFPTTEQPWDTKVPLTILINNMSASASEIVSGTLQDLDRAVVIGQRSYGKGLVQIIKPIGYNAKLKITTAKYYTATGRCIQSLDYSHKNPDGSVQSVPDSLKQLFKTKNGRKVYDGGGIEPDITLVNNSQANVIIALQTGKYIFDYATLYAAKNKIIASLEKFSITEGDYNEFKKMVAQQPENFNTESHKKLEELKLLLQKENNSQEVIKSLESINTQIIQHRIAEMDKYKNDIIHLLNQEIIKRYYYDEGVKSYLLHREDKGIATALDIIENSKHAQILQ